MNLHIQTTPHLSTSANPKLCELKGINTKTHYNQIVKTQRIFKAANENQLIPYKESFVCLTANFSSEIMKARKQWDDIFQVRKK